MSIAYFVLSVCSLAGCLEPKPSQPEETKKPALRPAATPVIPVQGPVTVPGPPVDSDESGTATRSQGSFADPARKFEGRSSVKRGKNISLSRSTAANRARAELAKKLRAAGKLSKKAPLPEGIQIEFEVTSTLVRARATLPSLRESIP